MKQAKHSAGFRLHLMYTPTHAKPAPGHSRAMRAASLFLAAACLLLSVSVYPATAATSMSSLQNKLDKLSQSIVQHKKELSNAKKKEQAAKALESELKEKVTVVQSQISVLKGQIAEVPQTWTLDYLGVTSGNTTIPTATVRLARSGSGKMEATVTQEASTGDGPVHAALRAIDRITGLTGELADYTLRAVSQGKDALGEVAMKVNFGGDEPVSGRGSSTDIVEASARAYLNAVNRHFFTADVRRRRPARGAGRAEKRSSP